jgi:hypothetical protein
MPGAYDVMAGVRYSNGSFVYNRQFNDDSSYLLATYGYWSGKFFNYFPEIQKIKMVYQININKYIL